MTATFTAQLITTQAELNTLQPEWNDLLQRSSANHIFFTWEWVASWWDCFAQERKPWVLTMRQAATGKLVGLAPFTRQRHITRKGLRYHELALIGCPMSAPDHLDLIVDRAYSQTVALALIRNLMAQYGRWDVMQLRGVAAASLLSPLLAHHSGYRLLSQEDCPYIQLPASWEAYAATLSKKMVENLAYSRRRLEKTYPAQVSFTQVADEQALPAALHTLYRLHTAVRAMHGEAGAFADTAMRTFHEKVAPLFLQQGWLRLYQLEISNEVIAMLYCFAYNGVLYYYQSGYNPDWKQYSPGSLIIAHAIQQAIAEGATEFDFLRGMEPYKLRWNPQVRHDLNVELTASLVKKLHQLYLGMAGLSRSLAADFKGWRAA